MTVSANFDLAAVSGRHGLAYYLIVVIVAGLAAFIPRYFPLRFFTNWKIPEWFNEWMKYVPISLFISLMVEGIFLSSKYQIVRSNLHIFNSNLVVFGHVNQIIASFLVAVVAYFTRSMAASVLIGLLGIWLIGMVI